MAQMDTRSTATILQTAMLGNNKHLGSSLINIDGGTAGG
jgi:hypothetical protein